MDTDQDDHLTLQEQVCFTLSVASREVVSLYRPLLEPLGLTHPQYLVMITLWGADGPVSVKRLSRRLQLEAPTLSPLLKRLENAGLVERQRDPADGEGVRHRGGVDGVGADVEQEQSLGHAPSVLAALDPGVNTRPRAVELCGSVRSVPTVV